MQPAEARELGVLEPRDHAEDAHLLGMLELGLEADHVPQRAERVVLPKLHHGMRPAPRARIVEPHGLHGPEAQASRARAPPSLPPAGSRRNSGVVASHSLKLVLSPASSASMKASYCSFVIGQLR